MTLSRSLRLLLLGFVVAAPGCSNTCVVTVLHYDGHASGRTIVKMWRDQTPSLTGARAMVVFPDADTALRWNGPGAPGARQTCWQVAGPETWNVSAWIDVAGVDTDAVCQLSSWDACVPHPGDPQGTGQGTTQIDVTIVDP